MKRIGSVILNLAIISGSIAGILFSSGGLNFMNADNGLITYYTIQSNIFVMLIAFISLYFELRAMRGKPVPACVFCLRLVGTVAITLTFAVFTFMLMPGILKAGAVTYLLTPGNLLVHNIVPLCVFADWCFFGSVEGLKPRSFWLTLLPPLAYVLFVVARVSSGLGFAGKKVPYFFFDYETLGWFRLQGGIGVVYWNLMLIVALILMTRLFVAIVRKRAKMLSEKSAD